MLPWPAGEARSAAAPAVVGLDHVIVAVGDLDAAAARYRALGFSLKPGRLHENGIRNEHVKFPDGVELELLTAPEARDELTTEYRRHLEGGDGPAFVGLFAPDRDRVAREVAAAGHPTERSGALLSVRDGDELDHLFFGGRNHSPTDRPEHFAHPNTAEALIGVWLASSEPAPELALLEHLGAVVERREVAAPDPVAATIARFAEGFVVLLPASRRIVADRPIVGVTFRVRDLAAARRAVEKGGVEVSATVEHAAGASLFLPPDLAHGLWIELREEAGDDAAGHRSSGVRGPSPVGHAPDEPYERFDLAVQDARALADAVEQPLDVGRAQGGDRPVVREEQ